MLVYMLHCAEYRESLSYDSSRSNRSKLQQTHLGSTFNLDHMITFCVFSSQSAFTSICSICNQVTLIYYCFVRNLHLLLVSGKKTPAHWEKRDVLMIAVFA